MSRQGGHHKKSKTRSATLAGRESLRKGDRQAPRQSLVVGLPMRVIQKDDRPSLPQDRLFVSLLPFIIATMHHKLCDLRQVRCFNCGASLGIKHTTEVNALAHPHRQGRPLGFIGKRCCLPKFADSREETPTGKRGAYQ